MVAPSKMQIALSLFAASAIGMAVAARTAGPNQPTKQTPIDLSLACHPSLSLAVHRKVVKYADRGDELIQFIGQDKLVFANRSDTEFKLELRCSRVGHWSPLGVSFLFDDNVPDELRTRETITIPPGGSKTITCGSGGLVSRKEWGLLKQEQGTAKRVVLSFDQKTVDPKQQPVGTLISSAITWDMQPKKK
jgi:hypothetical protein